MAQPEAKNPTPNGSSFGGDGEKKSVASVAPTMGRAASPRVNAAPSLNINGVPRSWVPEGHAPISDDFGGFNRYVGGTSISLNEFGGIDVGIGGPMGHVHEAFVHIHTQRTLVIQQR